MRIPVDLERKATPRMVAFIAELLRERDISEDARTRANELLVRHEDPDDKYRLPFDQAHRSIEWLLKQSVRADVVPSHISAMPSTPKESHPLSERDPRTLPTRGAFRYEDDVYIVVPTRGDPNRHYAMKMVDTPKRLTTSGKVVNFDFVRAPGIIWHLCDEHRLTPEEIKDLMIVHRMCIYPGCYRILKAAKSVERGAGKTHARKLGLI